MLFFAFQEMNCEDADHSPYSNPMSYSHQVDVNGNNTAPIYKFLKSSKGSIFGDSIKWNFSKFLVDKDGNVIDRYAPTTSPLSIEVNIPVPVP